MSRLTAVILAAGLGTRMKSALPKVLHPIAGRPLLHYAVRAAFDAGVEQAVVVTSGHEQIDQLVAKEFGHRVSTVVQDPPRGTGDAARIGIEQVKTERVLILCGDTPLVRAEELRLLVSAPRATGRRGAQPDDLRARQPVRLWPRATRRPLVTSLRCANSAICRALSSMQCVR